MSPTIEHKIEALGRAIETLWRRLETQEKHLGVISAMQCTQKTPIDKDILLKELELLSKLYTFYLDTCIRVYIFYFTVLGATLAFYLLHQGVEFIELSLLFDVVLGICLSVYSGKMATRVKEMEEWFGTVGSSLNTVNFPDVNPLKNVLITGCVAIGSITIVILTIFIVKIT